MTDHLPILLCHQRQREHPRRAQARNDQVLGLVAVRVVLESGTGDAVDGVHISGSFGADGKTGHGKTQGNECGGQ